MVYIYIYMHMYFGKITFADFCAYLVVTICLRENDIYRSLLANEMFYMPLG